MLKKQIVLALGLLCVTQAARANDWPELGGDCEESRGSSESSGATFTPSWTYALGSGQIIATPVSSGGTLVVAGSGGAVAALDAQRGTVSWTQTLAEGVRATPAVSGEQVAVSTMGGTLYSLGLADGQVAWQRTFGGQNYSSPQVVAKTSPDGADTIVVGAGFPQQSLWRFDAATGAPAWGTPNGAIAGLVYSSAAVAGDRVILGMNGGRYQSFDLATGATDWTYDASGPVYLSSPLVVGDDVYMFPGDRNASVFAVHASSGAPVAGFPVSIPDPAPVAGGQMFGQGPAVSSPMTIGGLVIVQLNRQDMLPGQGSSFQVAMREYVVAIDPATAQVKWQYPLASVVAADANGVPELNACATPAGFEGQGGALVAVSSAITARMAVLDAQTGQERWSTSLSAPGRSSPVFSNGQLFVATDASVVHAFSSNVNRAPGAPTQLGPSGAQAFVSAGNAVNWSGAVDPEGDALAYVVRLEVDGHPETRAETQTAPGQTQLTVNVQPNTAYLFAVRSQDSHGALSAWSTSQRFQVGDGSAPAMIATTDVPPPPAPALPAPSAPVLSAQAGASSAPPSGSTFGPPPSSAEPSALAAPATGPVIVVAPVGAASPTATAASGGSGSSTAAASATASAAVPAPSCAAPTVVAVATTANGAPSSSAPTAADSAASANQIAAGVAAEPTIGSNTIAAAHGSSPSPTMESQATETESGSIGQQKAELTGGGCSLAGNERSMGPASLALLAMIAFVSRRRRRATAA
jgi:outer membrane protein assembly factor BamB